MKAFSGAVAAVLLTAAISMAAASEEATGTVEEMDQEERTITLDDGTTYWLQDGVMMEDISIGQEITVRFEEQEGDFVAHEVEIAAD